MLVFVYGTLTDIIIRKNVIGRDVPGEKATLDGYDASDRITIENESYPVAEINTQGSIIGVVIELTSEEISKLDEYETDSYRREEVELTNGKKAWIYIKNSK